LRQAKASRTAQPCGNWWKAPVPAGWWQGASNRFTPRARRLLNNYNFNKQESEISVQNNFSPLLL
jgi:hypothetical protein